MLGCIEQRVHVVAGVWREYERVNPEADFGRACFAREEAVLGTVTEVTRSARYLLGETPGCLWAKGGSRL
jgi:hypothetical protein